MSVVTDTTNNENVLTQKKGNHKGCPYDGSAGGYFQRNNNWEGRNKCVNSSQLDHISSRPALLL